MNRRTFDYLAGLALTATLANLGLPTVVCADDVTNFTGPTMSQNDKISVVATRHVAPGSTIYNRAVFGAQISQGTLRFLQPKTSGLVMRPGADLTYNAFSSSSSGPITASNLGSMNFAAGCASYSISLDNSGGCQVDFTLANNSSTTIDSAGLSGLANQFRGHCDNSLVTDVSSDSWGTSSTLSSSVSAGMTRYCAAETQVLDASSNMISQQSGGLIQMSATHTGGTCAGHVTCVSARNAPSAGAAKVFDKSEFAVQD